MYLKKYFLRNAGPLESLNIELPFSPDGNPKPLVIIGQNGSGKTICLSYIIESLVELGKAVLRSSDHIEQSAISYRKTSMYDVPLGQVCNIAILEFLSQEEKIYFQYLNGAIGPGNYRSEIVQMFGKPLEFQGARKLEYTDASKIHVYFSNNSICFFPSYRLNHPFWLNDSMLHSIGPSTQDIFGAVLKKPLIISSASDDNKKWLVNLLSDAMEGSSQKIYQTVRGFRLNPQTDGTLSRECLTHVNSILKLILQDENAEFGLHPRNHIDRLCITKNNSLYLPSIHHLSTGQSILLDMFLSIIRYSDRPGSNTFRDPSQIIGMVINDEIDAHLHSSHQYSVLPALIRLFPKVQFILTTHSPLFLLGLNNLFGPDGFQLIDLPEGTITSFDKFSEFIRSFDYYADTEYFEKQISERLASQTKPLILTEGVTDVKYICTALQVLGRDDLLQAVNIDCIGSSGLAGSENGGQDALNKAASFIQANSAHIKGERILLLYDCDTNKGSSNRGRLSIVSIPRNDKNDKAKGGIENLLPAGVLEDRFYSTKVITGNDGGSVTKITLNKTELCAEICDARRNVANFEGFAVVVSIIEQFIARDNNGE